MNKEDNQVEFYHVEKFLSKEEFNHHLALSLCGTPSYNRKHELTVMMGSEAYQRVLDYQEIMTEKYRDKYFEEAFKFEKKARGSKFTRPKKKR